MLVQILGTTSCSKLDSAPDSLYPQARYDSSSEDLRSVAVSITVGDSNVSRRQLQSLDMMHRRRRPIGDVARSLYGIVTRPSVADGQEDLHPAWLDVYNRYSADLDSAESSLGPQRIATLRKIFGALQSLDPLVTTIDPNAEDIVFLLGAGASRPEPSDIPTVTDLLPELLTRARRIDREQLTSLADFCDRQGITNIEDLLTAVQISAFCSKNPRILSIIEFQLFGRDADDRPDRLARLRSAHADVSSVAYVQDTLQVLFGLLSSLMLRARPNAGHQAIIDYAKRVPNTPIVTTNYDCCIDLALINNEVPFSYGLEFANPSLAEDLNDVSCSLIKLHGSLNWYHCETCQEVRLVDIKRTIDDYTNERGEYAIVSVCNECGGQRRGLLVPPQAMKFDVSSSLQPLTSQAARFFAKATLIVVVGFSFSDADVYISRMLIKAMQGSTRTRIAIVDPDVNVTERVRRKFKAQIPDLDAEARIIKLQSDCSECLPELLAGRLFSQSGDDDRADQSDGRVSEVGLASAVHLTSDMT